MKECPNCKELVGDDVDVCFNCGYSYIYKRVLSQSERKISQQNEQQKINNEIAAYERKIKEEQGMRERAKIQIDKNPLYEYKFIVSLDKNDGRIDSNNIENILRTHSSNGWRLHTIFTNEIGKESTMGGFGGFSSSTNATRNEIVMVFERCIRKEIE